MPILGMLHFGAMLRHCHRQLVPALNGPAEAATLHREHHDNDFAQRALLSSKATFKSCRHEALLRTFGASSKTPLCVRTSLYFHMLLYFLYVLYTLCVRPKVQYFSLKEACEIHAHALPTYVGSSTQALCASERKARPELQGYFGFAIE